MLCVEYAKYLKSKSFKAINEVINTELKPLEQLIIANNSLEFFEEKQTKGEVIPGFRLEAARELFIKSLNEVTEILYFTKEIEKTLDTGVMLKRFEIPNWKFIRPFEFYISSLQKHYNNFREVLQNMHKMGKSKIDINNFIKCLIARWFYELSKNVDFTAALKELIDIDKKCEVIIGDSLKRDQIKFLYESARAFYESPVRPKLLPQDEQGKPAAEIIIKDLIPRLTSFRTIVYMHDIDRRKKKDIEEAEKLRKLNPPPVEVKEEKKEEEEEEKKEGEEEKKEEEEEDEETKEARRKEEAKKKQDAEDLQYGRYMIWEGILKEDKYPEWKISADQIDGINPHVIEDIQDYIIKIAYKPELEEGKKSIEEVKKKVEEERKEKLNSEKEEEKTITKVEIRLEKYRPDKRVWNYFLEKDSPYFRDHKFRIDANPFGIYEDGRVEKLWEDLKVLEVHLKKSEEVQWTFLVDCVLNILSNDQVKEEQALLDKKPE